MTLTHVVRILHITMSLPICPAHKYQMTYMSYTLELHVYPITMPSKPKLPEESSAQVDVHVGATCQGTQQLLLSSPTLEMQLLENWSAECVQLFGTFLAYYVELNWGTKENAELLTFLREMPRESWRWLDKAGWYSAQDWLHWKGVHERELHVYTLAPAVKWKNYKNNFFKKARMCYH